MTDTTQAAVHDGNIPGGRSYTVSAATEWTGATALGERFTLRTLDASGDQIREGVSFADVDAARMFPVTGPIRFDGVRAGDVVGLTLDDVRTAPFAHSWTRPGIGFGPDFGFHVRRIELADEHWPGSPDIRLRLQPHVGTLGVLPRSEHPARDLGSYGGNVDISELGAGATLWVTAEVDGGGVFAGDIHAGIGDAEICGTGLEAPGEVDLRVEVLPGAKLDVPVVTRGDRAWLLGVGDSFEEALSAASTAAIGAIVRHLGVPAAEAYLLVSQILEVRVCQIVNPRVSVSVSLREGLDVSFFPRKELP